MGIRFRRSKQIMPGVSVNISKSGAGVRLGGKGAGVSVNSKGQVTTSVGAPGTGLSYTQTHKLGSEPTDVDDDPPSICDQERDEHHEELMKQVYDKMSEIDAQENEKIDRRIERLAKAAKILWTIVGVFIGIIILIFVLAALVGDDDTAQNVVETSAVNAAVESAAAPIYDVPSDPVDDVYILNVESGKYHRKTCRYADSQNTREITPEEAENYTACKVCF